VADTLEWVLDRLERAFMTTAAVAVVAMMLTISADALGRYLLNRPLLGSYEFTSLYLMVVLTFMGTARTYQLGGHISLELALPALRRLTGGAIDRFNALLAAAALAAVTYFTATEAIERFRNLDTTFGAIQFPIYWSYVWVPLGCGLLSLRLITAALLGTARRNS
jgi:TRAP-type C4-dicarboxylate transport system permease small subunit